ncbi:MAG: hypothetical protein U0P45_16505 [Acidimicrobiales bacterium]
MSGEADVERIVRVLPDVVGIDKEFDYLVPAGVEVRVGDVVRIDLHGRRVGAWVVALDVVPEAGVALKPLAKVSGRGPAPELIDLAGWAADRWLGRRAHLLRTASPPGVVRSVALPAPRASAVAPTDDPVLRQALDHHRAVVRLGPGADRYPFVRAACEGDTPPGHQVLVLCPSVAEAVALAGRLRRDGVAVALAAHDRPGAAAAGEWARAASGAARAVVGARAAAWAPAPHLGRVVVLDEHDEAYQQEQAPTWNARDVAVERARRAGAPCALVSPCPSLEALAWGQVVAAPRAVEREAWPWVDVVDQRELDPALGPLFSPRLVDALRSGGRVLCILNRTGRARLLACSACRAIARCERCDAAVSLEAGDPDVATVDELACGRCGTRRIPVCLACGAHRFKNLRLGVSRAREELEVLAGEPVVEVTAASDAADPLAHRRIAIGTEALLHRVHAAEVVAFLDFDQELLSLRYRAAEEALALVARAGRIVRRAAARQEGATSLADRRGRVLVQTRSPDHPVLVAATQADPERLVASEQPMRSALGLPPTRAMARVSGDGAAELVAALGQPLGVSVQGPRDGAWRVLATDHGVLSEVLRSVPRPAARVRIEVDPLRA